MIRVRPGTEHDEDAALAVWQAAQAAQGLRSGGTRATRFRARLRSPEALLLVADGERPAAGVLLAVLGRADDGDGPVVPGLLHLAVLAVDPQARERGVARSLLAALTGRYPWVTAWARDEAEVALLSGSGFAPTGRERDGAVHLEKRPAPAGPPA